jgi:hypothetical protein
LTIGHPASEWIIQYTAIDRGHSVFVDITPNNVDIANTAIMTKPAS